MNRMALTTLLSFRSLLGVFYNTAANLLRCQDSLAQLCHFGKDGRCAIVRAATTNSHFPTVSCVKNSIQGLKDARVRLPPCCVLLQKHVEIVEHAASTLI